VPGRAARPFGAAEGLTEQELILRDRVKNQQFSVVFWQNLINKIWLCCPDGRGFFIREDIFDSMAAGGYLTRAGKLL
jgi:hypothetical protein